MFSRVEKNWSPRLYFSLFFGAFRALLQYSGYNRIQIVFFRLIQKIHFLKDKCWEIHQIHLDTLDTAVYILTNKTNRIQRNTFKYNWKHWIHRTKLNRIITIIGYILHLTFLSKERLSKMIFWVQFHTVWLEFVFKSFCKLHYREVDTLYSRIGACVHVWHEEEDEEEEEARAATD